MKTSDLLRIFGTLQGVADLFDISRSAVCQWGEEVPQLREYQLREKVPDIDSRIAELSKKVA